MSLARLLVVVPAMDEMQGFLRVVVTKFQTAIAWWQVSAAWGGAGAGKLHHVDDDPHVLSEVPQSVASCRRYQSSLLLR